MLSVSVNHIWCTAQSYISVIVVKTDSQICISIEQKQTQYGYNVEESVHV